VTRPRITHNEMLDLIRMKEVEGLSNREIARRTGVSEGAIRWRYSQARKERDSGFLTAQGRKAQEGIRRSDVQTPLSPFARRTLRELLEHYGYDPAEAVVGYRRILGHMIDNAHERIQVAKWSNNMQPPSSTMADGAKEDRMAQMRELLELQREALAIDERMMPYVYPKLTATAVKVDQGSKATFLVIEDPAEKRVEGEEVDD
jgi:AcrR family transcriptional regulator